MSTEIELKLSFPAQHAATIKQLALLKRCCSTQPIEQTILSIYYDTRDFALGRQRIALRTRKIGDQWLQTIKSGSSVHDGLHQQNEWEYPIRANALELDAIPDAQLMAVFADPQFRAALKPIFTTDFHRTTYLLEPLEGFKLEFCLDIGKIIAHDKTEPICEVELELKAGNSEQLIEFAHTLQTSCPFTFTPENRNKAARGYALLT